MEFRRVLFRSLVKVAGPTSKNPGRKYIKCSCGTFCWEEEHAKAMATSGECPRCGRKSPVRTAGPTSKNPGREYIKCGYCSEFTWTDEPATTDEERAQITADVGALLNVCDGALSRDSSGFNKYDASPARQFWADCQAGRATEADYRLMRKTLVKYAGQLGKESGVAA